VYEWIPASIVAATFVVGVVAEAHEAHRLDLADLAKRLTAPLQSRTNR
jgi:hypothetical protein